MTTSIYTWRNSSFIKTDLKKIPYLNEAFYTDFYNYYEMFRHCDSIIVILQITMHVVLKNVCEGLRITGICWRVFSRYYMQHATCNTQQEQSGVDGGEKNTVVDVWNSSNILLHYIVLPVTTRLSRLNMAFSI